MPSYEKKYPRGIEAVTGVFILNDKKEVLLVKSPKWKGWSISGGHVEIGEKIEDAVIRETKEEMGVDAYDVKPLCFGEGIVSSPDFPRDAHFIFLNYTAKIRSENFVFNDEITGYCWLDVNKAISSKEMNQNIIRPLLVLGELINTGKI